MKAETEEDKDGRQRFTEKYQHFSLKNAHAIKSFILDFSVSKVFFVLDCYMKTEK